MSDILDTISIRRQDELEKMKAADAAIERATKARAEALAKIKDLDTTAKTIAEIEGLEWPPAGQEWPEYAEAVEQAAETEPTKASVIIGVLATAQQEGKGPMRPTDIAAAAQAIDPTISTTYVNAYLWKRAARGQLKNNGGLYSLASKS